MITIGFSTKSPKLILFSSNQNHFENPKKFLEWWYWDFNVRNGKSFKMDKTKNKFFVLLKKIEIKIITLYFVLALLKTICGGTGHSI